MISLEWRRQRDMAWLPPGAPLTFGKTVVLRGVGYEPPAPDQFTLCRVPTKLVSWALAKQHKPARWAVATRRANVTSTAPFLTVDSEPIVLAPSGFLATHRWQFSDTSANWSPVVRTTRFSTLKSSLTGGHFGVGATVGATVQTTVDPTLRIDLSLPWVADKDYPSPQQAILQEIEDLRVIGADVEPLGGVIESLAQFFPAEAPAGLEVHWESRELSLEEAETRTFAVPIPSVSHQPFAFCFVATNMETGEVATSEVGVLWRSETGGVSAFGLEG
jgi:hypothetical protein